MKAIRLTLTLMLVYLMNSCDQRKTEKIVINVAPGEITVYNVSVNLDAFHSELKRAVGTTVREGYKEGELIIRLRVNSKTKREVLSDIEGSLRN